MIAAFRIVQRNALVYRRVWYGSVFFSFVTPTLFLLAMGLGAGSLIDPSAQLPRGVSYASFLAPGLLAGAAMQAAAFESSYPVLGKLTWVHTYQAIIATPVGIRDLVLGELAWIALRLSSIAIAFVAVMAVFGIPASFLVLLAIPAAALTGLVFASAIMAKAAKMQESSEFNVMFRFIITPLFLFSGIFFPVDRLPALFQAVAWGTPLFHGVELVRGLTLGSLPERWPVHLGYLMTAASVGTVLAIRNFGRRLHA